MSASDLSALYRLEFYRNQKNWKFCNEESCKTRAKSRPLNQTYCLEQPKSNDRLNEAFLETSDVPSDSYIKQSPKQKSKSCPNTVREKLEENPTTPSAKELTTKDSTPVDPKNPTLRDSQYLPPRHSKFQSPREPKCLTPRDSKCQIPRTPKCLTPKDSKCQIPEDSNYQTKETLQKDLKSSDRDTPKRDMKFHNRNWLPWDQYVARKKIIKQTSSQTNLRTETSRKGVNFQDQDWLPRHHNNRNKYLKQTRSQKDFKSQNKDLASQKHLESEDKDLKITSKYIAPAKESIEEKEIPYAIKDLQSNEKDLSTTKDLKSEQNVMLTQRKLENISEKEENLCKEVRFIGEEHNSTKEKDNIFEDKINSNEVLDTKEVISSFKPYLSKSDKSIPQTEHKIPISERLERLGKLVNLEREMSAYQPPIPEIRAGTPNSPTMDIQTPSQMSPGPPQMNPWEYGGQIWPQSPRNCPEPTYLSDLCMEGQDMAHIQKMGVCNVEGGWAEQVEYWSHVDEINQAIQNEGVPPGWQALTLPVPPTESFESEELIRFMIEAHCAPHSSEIDLHTSLSQLENSDSLCSASPLIVYEQARRAARLLRRAINEARDRDRTRSTQSLDAIPLQSYEEYPTRDVGLLRRSFSHDFLAGSFKNDPRKIVDHDEVIGTGVGNNEGHFDGNGGYFDGNGGYFDGNGGYFNDNGRRFRYYFHQNDVGRKFDGNSRCFVNMGSNFDENGGCFDENGGNFVTNLPFAPPGYDTPHESPLIPSGFNLPHESLGLSQGNPTGTVENFPQNTPHLKSSPCDFVGEKLSLDQNENYWLGDNLYDTPRDYNIQKLSPQNNNLGRNSPQDYDIQNNNLGQNSPQDYDIQKCLPQNNNLGRNCPRGYDIQKRPQNNNLGQNSRDCNIPKFPPQNNNLGQNYSRYYDTQKSRPQNNNLGLTSLYHNIDNIPHYEEDIPHKSTLENPPSITPICKLLPQNYNIKKKVPQNLPSGLFVKVSENDLNRDPSAKLSPGTHSPGKSGGNSPRDFPPLIKLPPFASEGRGSQNEGTNSQPDLKDRQSTLKSDQNDRGGNDSIKNRDGNPVKNHYRRRNKKDFIEPGEHNGLIEALCAKIFENMDSNYYKQRNEKANEILEAYFESVLKEKLAMSHNTKESDNNEFIEDGIQNIEVKRQPLEAKQVILDQTTVIKEEIPQKPLTVSEQLEQSFRDQQRFLENTPFSRSNTFVRDGEGNKIYDDGQRLENPGKNMHPNYISQTKDRDRKDLNVSNIEPRYRNFENVADTRKYNTYIEHPGMKRLDENDEVVMREKKIIRNNVCQGRPVPWSNNTGDNTEATIVNTKIIAQNTQEPTINSNKGVYYATNVRDNKNVINIGVKNGNFDAAPTKHNKNESKIIPNSFPGRHAQVSNEKVESAISVENINNAGVKIDVENRKLYEDPRIMQWKLEEGINVDRENPKTLEQVFKGVKEHMGVKEHIGAKDSVPITGVKLGEERDLGSAGVNSLWDLKPIGKGRGRLFEEKIEGRGRGRVVKRVLMI